VARGWLLFKPPLLLLLLLLLRAVPSWFPKAHVSFDWDRLQGDTVSVVLVLRGTMQVGTHDHVFWSVGTNGLPPITWESAAIASVVLVLPGTMQVSSMLVSQTNKRGLLHLVDVLLQHQSAWCWCCGAP
jgi:hypothetical protein